MSSPDTELAFELIDTSASLGGLVDTLAGADWVSIDTEADSFHHFHHKVCLIQIAVGDRCFVVDPLAGLELSSLMDVLAQKSLIFHDAGYDLRMMLADFGFRPQNAIFDTMLAARLIGLENISLSALLESILDIQMSKQNQRANWAVRPIPQTLLAYAAEDVRYLSRLAEHLSEKLVSLGRLEWHREYCQWTVAQTQQAKAPDDPDKSWRIRGTFGLPPRQMAFVRTVWHWRQNQADCADLSPFRILHNEQLIDLALWAERQKDIHPDKLPRLPRHCRGSRRSELLAALQTAQRLGPEDWPKPIRRDRTQKPDSETLKKTERLKAECQKIADSLALPPQLIASRKSLLAAVNTGADTEQKLLRIGWMRWQAGLLLSSIRNVLTSVESADEQRETE